MILFGRARPMKISAVIGDFERKQVWLRGLELGQAEFGREPAFLVQRDGGDFDGLMSPASLGITRVGIDVERGVLAFSR